MYDDTPLQVFDFHHSMLLDDIRTRSFQDAILNTVETGDVVLDLGCGTGVLSLFACLAGAKKVYAVEQGPVINVARAVAVRNGFGARIEFFEGWSTQIDLPEPVDVIVTETIGNMTFDEGIVGSVIDARRRFLREGGRQVPRSLELAVALVESHEDYADLDRWARPFYQLDFSPLRSLAVNTPLPTSFSEHSLMSEAQPMIHVDLTNVEDVNLEGRVEFAARRSGVAHGLGCWFSSELSPGLVLSNGPPNRVPSWDQVLLPFEAPLALTAGDTVEVQIRASGNGSDWEWQARTGSANSTGHLIRQSSARFAPSDTPSGKGPEQPR